MSRSILAAALLSVAVPPVSAQTDPVHVIVPEFRIAAGEEVEIWVEIRIDPELRVMANPASEEWLQPLQLTLTGPNGWSVGPVSYPDGRDYAIDGMDVPMRTYGDSVLLTVRVRAPFGARPETVGLRGELSYQGCRRHACLVPSSVPVEIRGEVRAEAAKATFAAR